MIKAIMYDVLFVGLIGLSAWRIFKNVQMRTASYRGSKWSQAEAPAAFWFVATADLIFFGAGIYGLWMSLHPLNT